MTNKHGLPRDIPAKVKREVRQRCGFGCVVCGNVIIEYHHFDPEYIDATKHLVKGITLLCPTCHTKVTKRTFDTDFITLHNKNPKCKQTGFTTDIFYIGPYAITFRIGSANFKRVDIIKIAGSPLISFSPPEQAGGPLLLNARLYDNQEKELLIIKDNEWLTESDNFDIETTSNHLIIREKAGDIKLKLSHTANKEIFIERINMKYKGFQIQIENKNFIVKNSSGGTMQLACPSIYATLNLNIDGSMSVS